MASVTNTAAGENVTPHFHILHLSMPNMSSQYHESQVGCTHNIVRMAPPLPRMANARLSNVCVYLNNRKSQVSTPAHHSQYRQN